MATKLTYNNIKKKTRTKTSAIKRCQIEINIGFILKFNGTMGFDSPCLFQLKQINK